ncbi:MAG TPA: EAL domain-containing protein [Rhizomicrobium sp.]|nr:EAL domain-containing protein [Rhizomicrobium sp.]
MPQPARLLGFAFAGADLLFEVSRNGQIMFATGAASDFARKGAEALVGHDVSCLFEPLEANKFMASVRGLGEGDRVGPMRLKLITGAPASISMFRLPLTPGVISCTLAKPGGKSAFAGTGVDKQTGLATRDAFVSTAAKVSKETDALTLVEVPKLSEICAKMPEAQVVAFLEALGFSATTSGAKAVGRLSDSSFGAITSPEGRTAFVESIRKALAEGGANDNEIEHAQISLKGDGLSADQRVLAVRYVVERFASGGTIADCGGDLASTFGAMMSETESRMRDITQTVSAGNFAMAYQPIKSLKNDALSHYESLVRFDANKTAETVAMVEQLGMAASFDLAVAFKVLAAVQAEKDKSIHVAINLSGHTIASSESFGLIAGILARHRALAPRLLIEITETAEIHDLEAANRSVAALRAMGYRVGLDDFGAGAASLNYLHGLTVDFVKFDGSLVKKLGTSERDDTLLRGMLKLCNELGMHTIAECIETQEQADMAREIGFDYGQGFFLGKPQKDLRLATTGGFFAKRKGVQEGWG